MGLGQTPEKAMRQEGNSYAPFLLFIPGVLGVILLVVYENSRKSSPAVRNLGLGLIGFMPIGITSLKIE